MNPQKARIILDNDDELDIAQMAEAHAEVNKRKQKKKNPIPSLQRSVSAYHKLKAKQQEAEAWRQKLAKIWKPKTK